MSAQPSGAEGSVPPEEVSLFLYDAKNWINVLDV
jgi:hypothetical protein